MKFAALDKILKNPIAMYSIIINNVTYDIPITDHHPIVRYTKAGPIVTLNIWCPGSPIAPSFLAKLDLSSPLCVVNSIDQKSQMELIALYLVEMNKAGAVAFMLQEVPSPETVNFTILIKEIERLYPERFDIKAMLNTYRSTIGTRSGTCALLEKNKLSCVISQNDQLEIDMKNRGGVYHLKIQDGSDKHFKIANLHGDYMHPEDTVRIIDEAVKEKYMICGDWNIAKNQKNLLNRFEQYGHSGAKYPLETLDGFYDAADL